MSRRRIRPPARADYPPPLDAFDPADWWVDDLEDPLQVGYARIRWGVARRVYREGGDWEAHLEPPVWAQLEIPRLVQRGSAYTAPVPEEPGQGVRPQVNRAAVAHRGRPIRSR